MKFTRVISSLVISILITFNFSFGQNGSTSPFKLDFTKEAILLGSGAAVGATALLIISNLDPLTMEQINDLNPDDVNSFDRQFIGPLHPDHAGDILLVGSYLLPLTFLAVDDTRKDFWDLGLMYGEVLLINAGLTGIVKGTVTRIRPFAYDSNTPIEKKTDTDARVSFYSGHTSFTASACFFTARVFSEYLTDNTAKILIWSAAAIYPAVSGILRVNAHSHFPTDVIVGYIVGAAIGYLIPELHKSNKENNISLQSSGNLHNPVLSIQIKF
ncbi:MAG: phosphatase PAP2 family protein [Ignavibacteriaceae bacterium]|jgi:membrane-associated phospholipid phosphatase|nr:phosphatase PAP2 family protein [Ignavibacteriaceae bacterium]MCW8817019.1 phosphatase PAP2 family protein [Ignavibacteriaceae bacterium]MCW9094463.1 phosphatase PAP2 family protein [Ignavibacteriaceae bacterium]